MASSSCPLAGNLDVGVWSPGGPMQTRTVLGTCDGMCRRTPG